MHGDRDVAWARAVVIFYNPLWLEQWKKQMTWVYLLVLIYVQNSQKDSLRSLRPRDWLIAKSGEERKYSRTSLRLTLDPGTS